MIKAIWEKMNYEEQNFATEQQRRLLHKRYLQPEKEPSNRSRFGVKLRVNSFACCGAFSLQVAPQTTKNVLSQYLHERIIEIMQMMHTIF